MNMSSRYLDSTRACKTGRSIVFTVKIPARCKKDVYEISRRVRPCPLFLSKLA